PLLEVATCVNATCTLDGCTLTVPSGVIMYVMDDSQWSTSGAVGNLILSNGDYTGTVKQDNGYTANITVQSTATWNLTANTTVTTLVNNGTINCNGYTLTYTSLSGNGTINSNGGTNGIEDVEMEQIVNDPRVFTIDGRYLGTEVPATFRGVYIQNGKKHVKLR
nr:hypothetical protein [Bacteroidales bacterium]